MFVNNFAAASVHTRRHDHFRRERLRNSFRPIGRRFKTTNGVRQA